MAFLSFFILSLIIQGCLALTVSECGSYSRRPDFTDIAVVCGTESIDLAIQVCPVIYTGYNESLLFLNHIVDNLACRGTLDTLVTPPVVRFRFALRQVEACGSIFRTTSAPGTGVFSDFSNIQTVNISGLVRSYDPTIGTVTYNAELKYLYSCAYPLEYLINNTQIDVSSSYIGIKDNNGSFLSTLNMQLFSNANYTRRLVIPAVGIELRTNIYVQVKASNLTSQYFVLLDRCYASISDQPSSSKFFNLFVSCSRDELTTMTENGQSQEAKFSFPAFRFVEQQNQTTSTYYLHCITRLCERISCNALTQCNRSRRRRDAETSAAQDGVSNTTLITSVPIMIKAERTLTANEEGGEDQALGAAVGLGTAVAVLIVIGAVALLMTLLLYRKLRRLN